MGRFIYARSENIHLNGRMKVDADKHAEISMLTGKRCDCCLQQFCSASQRDNPRNLPSPTITTGQQPRMASEVHLLQASLHAGLGITAQLTLAAGL